MARKIVQAVLLVILLGLLAYVMLYDVIQAGRSCPHWWNIICIDRKLEAEEEPTIVSTVDGVGSGVISDVDYSGTIDSGSINGDILFVDSGLEDLAFSQPTIRSVLYISDSNQKEIIRFDINGDIFVHGRKTVNDVDIYKGLLAVIKNYGCTDDGEYNNNGIVS